MVGSIQKFQDFWKLDLCGAAAALLILVFGFWFGFFKADAAGQRIASARTFGTSQMNDLQRLRQQIQEQELIRDGHLQSVTDRGTLPSESYIDRDLATITSIARRCDLDIADVAPQEPIKYSGVLEQRYNLNLVGEFPNYVYFLREFERSDCWADITSLSIRSQPSDAQNPHRQTGQLAVSFFSVQRASDSAQQPPPVEGTP